MRRAALLGVAATCSALRAGLEPGAGKRQVQPQLGLAARLAATETVQVLCATASLA